MNRDELYNTMLSLLSFTGPHPNERRIIEPHLPSGGTWDDEDNYILEIGQNSKTLFCAHIDTVGKSVQETNPIFYKNFLFTGNDAADCLGGDDRCGVLSLLSLISEGVPGTYIFHNCEERGANGAQHINKTFDLSKFNRAIEFDRRGTSSIITEMSASKVCSVDFAKALAESLNEEGTLDYNSDPTGSFTDVYFYKEIIPEITNLSVGYYNEHSNKECISILWLIDNFIPRITKIKWEELPTVRDPILAAKEEEEWYSNFRKTYSVGWNRKTSSRLANKWTDKWIDNWADKWERDSRKNEESHASYNGLLFEANNLDDEFERSMLEDEENWEPPKAVGYKHRDSNYGEIYGVCDCCGEETFIDTIDKNGKYMFCEDCVELYENCLKDTSDYLDIGTEEESQAEATR